MLVVVVLTYAPAPGMLEECVAAVRRAGDADLVVVVDNGTSARDRLHHVDQVDGPGVEVIVTGRNLGYAGGMNVGIRRAVELGADAVALLNDDVVVEPGWLGPLLAEFAADTRLGTVQPKLLFAGADPPVVNSLGVELGPDGAGRDIGHGAPDDPADVASRDVEACTGGAVLLRRTFLDDVGMFDERYFLYYEDVDLALRGTARGWRHRCVPASRVWHRGSATVQDAGTLAARLRERNRIWTLVRHRPAGDVGRGVWLAVRRVRHAPRGAHLAGLVAGLAGVPGRLVERRRAARRPR